MNTFSDTAISRTKLWSHRLIMVSGKGGTGKSLVAASLACLAAKSGLRVLLVGSSSSEQLAPLLPIQSTKSSQASSARQSLTLVNLSPEDCMRGFIEDHLKMKQLYQKIFRHRVMRSFTEAIPGLDEIMLLGWLHNKCKPPSSDPREFDLVIFDAPASGHFFGLIGTPSAVLSSGLTGPMIGEIRNIQSFLQDPQQSCCLLVSLPESLVSSETLDFAKKITESGHISLKGILLNRCLLSETLSAQLRQLKEEPTVIRYLERRYQQSIKEQKHLQSELEMSALPAGLLTLPESGQIPEPLTPEFLDVFWESLAP
ncbi:MAG: hypothetical protein H6618_03855 [Deltaproteobacteria bacterium]|nr:hypothetical protein [Deltaproteobacteria bacterium]